MSINKNILQAYPDIESSPYYGQYVVGKPINTQYLLHSEGIDPQTGRHLYQDPNHDGIISTAWGTAPGTHGDDRVAEIDLSPVFFGGFGSDLRYKNLMLNLQFSYVRQKGPNIYSAGGSVIGSISNQPAEIVGNYWRQPGDKALFARPTTVGTTSDSYFQSSDGAFTDASFIRLSNLTISYSLPAKILKKAGIQGCNLSIRTNNVFVITSYRGLDPELRSFGAQPVPKIYDAGISLTF
jgi:hypothetical protein